MIGKIIQFLMSLAIAIMIQNLITLRLLELVRFPSVFVQGIVIGIQTWAIYILLKGWNHWTNIDRISLFCIYYVLLGYMLLGRYDMGVALTELDPLEWIRNLYYGSSTEWIVALFNVLAFIPMPILHGFFLKSSMKQSLSCLVVCIGFEVLQALSHRGIFDVGDILLYVLGVSIGLAIEHWILNKNIFYKF